MPKNPITEYVAASPDLQALIRWAEIVTRPYPAHFHRPERTEYLDGATDALNNLRDRLMRDDAVPFDRTWVLVDAAIRKQLEELNR